jgi:hypothetical protein
MKPRPSHSEFRSCHPRQGGDLGLRSFHLSPLRQSDTASPQHRCGREEPPVLRCAIRSRPRERCGSATLLSSSDRRLWRPRAAAAGRGCSLFLLCRAGAPGAGTAARAGGRRVLISTTVVAFEARLRAGVLRFCCGVLVGRVCESWPWSEPPVCRTAPRWRRHCPEPRRLGLPDRRR